MLGRLLAVTATYQAVQQQLPTDPTLEGFSSSNQIGVAQLAIQYCNEAANTPALQPTLFGSTLSAGQFPAGSGTVTSALANRVLGNSPKSQPVASTVTTELNALIGLLCSDNDCTTIAGTKAVAAAACATAFGSADMLIN